MVGETRPREGVRERYERLLHADPTKMETADIAFLNTLVMDQTYIKYRRNDLGVLDTLKPERETWGDGE